MIIRVIFSLPILLYSNIAYSYDSQYLYEHAEEIDACKQAISTRVNLEKQCTDKFSQMALGFYYETGSNGFPVDCSQQIKWYQRAYDNGSIEVSNNLAKVYMNTECPAKNIQKAHSILSTGAEKGNMVSQHNLALFYFKGIDGNIDYPKALSWYTKAADSGNFDSMYNLSKMYSNGYGTDIDYKKSFELVHKIASHTDGIFELEKLSEVIVESNFDVGFMYHNGIGAEKNEQRAFHWFLKSAKKKHPLGMYYTGLYYLNGIAVKKDETKAREFLTKSAELGIVGAKEKLISM